MSVTLSKLSLRNAQRQARDYLVYFVTIVMAAALLYSFNGLVFSQEVQFLSDEMKVLPLVIILASIVVVCVFGWLVNYATGFMLSRHSRELGNYILIGLTNRQVVRLFFLENLSAGGAGVGRITIPNSACNPVRHVRSALSFLFDILRSGSRADPVLFYLDLSSCPSEKPKAHPENENIRSHLL